MKESSRYLVKVIDGLRAVSGALQVHVHVHATRHDELPRGVDGAGAAGDDQVVPHQPHHPILRLEIFFG